MRFLERILIAAVATAIAVAVSVPAAAHGYNDTTTDMLGPLSRNYSGAWPVTVTRSQNSNGTGCLTLTGTTRGLASLVFGSQKFPEGSFVVLNGVLVATIEEPLYGQNGALLLIADAKRGQIGDGVFENLEGGSNFDHGALAFGAKNGC